MHLNLEKNQQGQIAMLDFFNKIKKETDPPHCF